MKNRTRIFLIFALLVCAALLPACVTAGRQADVVSKEDLLTAAGFTTKIASTPQQIAHLRALPANKITQVTKNGQPRYVYTDPAKNLVYVGTPGQFEYYKQLKKERNAVQSEDQYIRMSADTSHAVDVWGEDWPDRPY